jgi:osmotically inducible protein OsmC
LKSWRTIPLSGSSLSREGRRQRKRILLFFHKIKAAKQQPRSIIFINTKSKKMKFTRKAVARWIGPGKDGKGTLTTGSKVLNETPYSFRTRFEDVVGTNPEELIAAAHSGCFTMQLSFLLGDAGFTPGHLETEAKLTFEDGNITAVHLDLHGRVKGMDEKKFLEVANKAKEICPVSKLLKAAITLSAKLDG